MRNDADGACRDHAVGASMGDDTSDEIVHMPLASPALLAGYRHIKLPKFVKTRSAHKTGDRCCIHASGYFRVHRSFE
jgi:hypothetical protein